MCMLLKHVSLVFNLRYTSDLLESSLLYLTPGMIKDQTATPGLETPHVLNENNNMEKAVN